MQTPPRRCPGFAFIAVLDKVLSVQKGIWKAARRSGLVWALWSSVPEEQRGFSTSAF
jgi:hypothetical protein